MTVFAAPRRQLKRNTLGGIWTERHLTHEMQLMVMLSNAIVCWRVLTQAPRDEQCIRMPWCADLVSGKLICSCPMQSNAKLCWRGLLKRNLCGQAFRRLGVPAALRHADLLCLLLDLSVQPPNQRVQSTPLRVERDRSDFES